MNQTKKHLPFLDGFRGIAILGVFDFFPNTSIHPLMTFFGCLALYPVLFLTSSLLYQLVERPSGSLGRMAWDRMNHPIKVI